MGRDERAIRAYIRAQEQEDRRQEQLRLDESSHPGACGVGGFSLMPRCGVCGSDGSRTGARRRCRASSMW